MSTHCSRYPQCGCPKEIGMKCNFTETGSGFIRSDLHKSICEIIGRLPLKKVEGDCYDAISAATDIEKVFISSISATPSMEEGLKEVIEKCISYRDSEKDKHLSGSGLNFAINLMQELALSSNSSGWIKVEDKLPDIHPVAKYSNRVFCMTNTGKMEVGYLADGIWARDNGHYFSGHGYTITYWMPLPLPPISLNSSADKQ